MLLFHWTVPSFPWLKNSILQVLLQYTHYQKECRKFCFIWIFTNSIFYDIIVMLGLKSALPMPGVNLFYYLLFQFCFLLAERFFFAKKWKWLSAVFLYTQPRVTSGYSWYLTSFVILSFLVYLSLHTIKVCLPVFENSLLFY